MPKALQVLQEAHVPNALLSHHVQKPNDIYLKDVEN
jgi:hypothetical protein